MQQQETLFFVYPIQWCSNLQGDRWTQSSCSPEITATSCLAPTYHKLLDGSLLYMPTVSSFYFISLFILSIDVEIISAVKCKYSFILIEKEILKN